MRFRDRSLCLFSVLSLLTSNLAFSASPLISSESFAEMQKYIGACNEMGMTPKPQMYGLQRYLADKVDLPISRIQCGGSDIGNPTHKPPAQMFIVTTERPRAVRSEYYLMFRKTVSGQRIAMVLKYSYKWGRIPEETFEDPVTHDKETIPAHDDFIFQQREELFTDQPTGATLTAPNTSGIAS